MNSKVVLYGVWPNCNNNCKFCLRQNRAVYDKKQMIQRLDSIIKNIELIDWKNEYSAGISLLGGELYNIVDVDVQCKFMQLIDTIIDNILINSPLTCRYSTVTNGLYDSTFLEKVLDCIVSKVDILHVDLNFSYDLKYRYLNNNDRLLALSNINKISNKYNYCVGVLMILTQYLIDMIEAGQFDINHFMQYDAPRSQLQFLYPHKIATLFKIDDFFFRRKSFLNFMTKLKTINSYVYKAFMHSIKNSSVFKYTGLKVANSELECYDRMPVLSDGKNEYLDCGHSVLYKCYADSDKCVVCDLMSIYGDIF